MLSAGDRGNPRWEVTGSFVDPLSTHKRWLRRRQSEGSAPKPSPGRTPRILATDEERRGPWARLEANDDAILGRHCKP